MWTWARRVPTRKWSAPEKDARRLRRAAGDSRWRTLGRWRWAARAFARGKHAPVRSVLVGLASFADRDLILPKSASSTYFRACGCTAFRAPGASVRASLAPEFVGSVRIAP